ncbi:MAG TPA: DUF3871 family protein [Hanamia sp.]|nr:DUF3871 family protein [Hanamia sp.]
MENLETITHEIQQVINPVQIVTEQRIIKRNSFIEANTTEGNLQEIQHNHIIPVYANNEPLISHADFIDVRVSSVKDGFGSEEILAPEIRVSHPVMGRVPEAKDKRVDQLEEWEKTLYYQKMAFIIEIPSIHSDIDGNTLSLTIGGVRSFAEENLSCRSATDQHFRVFIGFKNTVCCNMCVWTDGYLNDIKVKTLGQLKGVIRSLFESYNKNYQLLHLEKLAEYSITEQQFAQVVGKCRMYQHLPTSAKREIAPILFGDQQMSTVVRDFYNDQSFCRDSDGNINLWRLYNLLTGSNKSSYIDRFLDRSVNAYNFTEQIRWALEGKNESWYLN